MSVFYVYQGDTFDEESKGGYVWSPQLAKGGKQNVGYNTMKKIHKDDFILHNCNGKIKAVSIAKTDCYAADKPEELNNTSSVVDWDNNGYRVDTEYFIFENPLVITDYKSWLAAHYVQDSAFNINGTGKQQYMCNLDDLQAIFIIKEALKLQNYSTTKVSLQNALNDIVIDKDSEYDSFEKEEIDSIVETETNEKPEWKGIKQQQEMKTSKTTGREIPKRNTKIAADALCHADYTCEFNNEDRTFIRKNGRPYTEPHHLIPMSKYRDFEYAVDVMENIVSLCSHCHNLLHYGRLEDKEPVLRKLYEDRIEALKNVGLDLSFEQLMTYYK